jgi:hypothetical protein
MQTFLPCGAVQSFMSHLAMKIFASLSVSANVWIIWERHLPIWLMAPAGAIFSVVLLMEARTPTFLRRSRKDRSRIERKSLDLCGIAAIGEIFSSLGGLSLMSSHRTSRACFMHTFSIASVLKCAIALGERAER